MNDSDNSAFIVKIIEFSVSTMILLFIVEFLFPIFK